MMMDTEREKAISLGTLYPFGKLGPGECVINTDWQEDYELSIGDKIQLSLKMGTFEYIVS